MPRAATVGDRDMERREAEKAPVCVPICSRERECIARWWVRLNGTLRGPRGTSDTSDNTSCRDHHLRTRSHAVTV